jgi:uncharacterized protein YcfJ
MLMFRGPLTAAAPGNTLNASNSMFGCEESQQLVVKQVAAGNELQLAMKCVDTAPRTAAYVEDSFAPRALRVSQPISTTRAVSAPAAPRTVTRQVEQPKRSWQKTALVIGGSAGAGAGVGAIAGGKKGALIGAAIGGGAASIFEAIKRKN